jgi:hypothetical protein
LLSSNGATSVNIAKVRCDVPVVCSTRIPDFCLSRLTVFRSTLLMTSTSFVISASVRAATSRMPIISTSSKCARPAFQLFGLRLTEARTPGSKSARM